MRANEFITEKKKRKKTKARRAAYGPGLFGGYGYYSDYGNSDNSDGGGDGGESIHENITPTHIHKLADRKGVKWDNEPSFLQLTKQLTGKEHLDDLDQVGLQKVKQHLEKQGVAEGEITKAAIEYKIKNDDGKFSQRHVEFAKSDLDKQLVRLKNNPNIKDVKIVQGVAENFADGKNPGRKGLAKRSGVNTKASVSSLRKTAKNSSGEKQRMAHWLANMKAGRAKKK